MVVVEGDWHVNTISRLDELDRLIGVMYEVLLN